MKHKTLLLLAAAAMSIGAMTSCSKQDISGSWSGTQTRLDNVIGASDASTAITFSFMPDSATGDSDHGQVLVSALISANQPVAQDSTIISPYEVSVAATASIAGNWTYEKDDDDDIIISFDPSTFRIDVDNNGVVFAENMISGRQQPEVDSLTAVTVNAWRNALGPAMRDEFNKYQKLSDVEVHKGILTFEVGKTDYSFRQTAK